VRGRAERRAAFPGERIRFEASVDVEGADAVIAWSGGGDPATGSGTRFETVFRDGGVHEVVVRCGDEVLQLPITICEVDAWLSRAASFYGPSVDLTRVRVASTRWVRGPAGTAWTCNDTIRFKRPVEEEDLPHEATLIHELGHVWEHQSGQAQLLVGIVEQVGRAFGRDPYDYGGPERLRTAGDLTEFSKESQAQIITELWRSRHGSERDRRGVPFDVPGYVAELERLVSAAGIGARASRHASVASWIDAALARVVNAVVDRLG
jgi:hypothetical protein